MTCRLWAKEMASAIRRSRGARRERILTGSVFTSSSKGSPGTNGDEVAVETLFEVMDGDNTRVVERGRRPGLLAEPRSFFGRGGPKNFDGNVALEPCVARLVHDAHAAAPELCENLVALMGGEIGPRRSPGHRRSFARPFQLSKGWRSLAGHVELMGKGYRGSEAAGLEGDSDHRPLQAGDGRLTRVVLLSPFRHVEDHARYVGYRPRVVLQDLAGFAEKTFAVKLDQGILQVSEPSHAVRRADGVSKTSVELKGPLVLAGPLGTPGCSLDVTRELVNIARLTPPIKTLEDGCRQVPQLCVDSQIGGLGLLVLMDQPLDGFLRSP